MGRVLRVTTAIYPSMGITGALSLVFSYRARIDERTILDRIFPLTRLEHLPGAGTFVPGTFAANFFLPSLILMFLLNAFVPARVGPLLPERANVFYYIFFMVVAILEIGTDTILPLVHLPDGWGLKAAIALLNGAFLCTVALAAAVSRGAGREW